MKPRKTPARGWRRPAIRSTALPLLLYLARKHDFDLRAALLANANVGGDNVHRGMILGMLVGAAEDGGLPPDLRNGLAAADQLRRGK